MGGKSSLPKYLYVLLVINASTDPSLASSSQQCTQLLIAWNLSSLFQVQPCVGIWSDKCTSKYGRRRPFIFVGSLMISLSVSTYMLVFF